MSNAIMVIHPYKHEGMWVFDDEKVGLIKEPFVSGADEIIETMVASIPDAHKGFNLVFSSIPFPGYQLELAWRSAESGGHWYHAKDIDREGWLCPALFKYFEEAPKHIYAQFKAKNI